MYLAFLFVLDKSVALLQTTQLYPEAKAQL